MLRTIVGVITGFVAWSIAWFGGEQIFSAIWPEGFGAHQRAFQAAIENGGPFTADTTMLLIHIVLGSLVSVMSGSLTALIARENKRAPLFLGVLLLAFGVLKAVMSWPYVPMWYHVIFTAMLLPMTIWGGRMKSSA
jgi:hypothetical protein